MDFSKWSPLAATLALLVGCGGGSGGSGTGTLTVGLTDATVEDVEEVRLYLTGITIKPQGGPPESYGINPAIVNCDDLDPVPATPPPDCNPINLLALADGNVLTVLLPTEVSAGAYQWLRLEVDNDLSYVIDDMGATYTGDSGMLDVRVPSERGLQLIGGFVVRQDHTTAITMDWEARRGLTNPVGQDGYILKPTIRIVDTDAWGSIFGEVADGVMMDSCLEGAAVYVYEGDLPSQMIDPDDIDNEAPDPLVTAPVSQRDNGGWGYRVQFLTPGTYSAALTCDAELDRAPEDDMDDTADNDDVVSFTPAKSTTVTEGAESRIDFDMAP